LDQGVVAKCARCRPVRGFDEPFRLAGGERARELAASLRQVELRRWVVTACAEQELMAEERPQGGDAARDRGRRQAGSPQLREVALEVVRRRACHGPAEPDGERVKVTPV